MSTSRLRTLRKGLEARPANTSDRLVLFDVPFSHPPIFFNSMLLALEKHAPIDPMTFNPAPSESERLRLKGQFESWKERNGTLTSAAQVESLAREFSGEELASLVSRYVALHEPAVIRHDLANELLEATVSAAGARPLILLIGIDSIVSRGILLGLLLTMNKIAEYTDNASETLTALLEQLSHQLFDLPSKGDSCPESRLVQGHDPRQLALKCLGLCTDAFARASASSGFDMGSPVVSRSLPVISSPPPSLLDGSIWLGGLDENGLPDGMGVFIAKDHSEIVRGVFKHGVLEGSAVRMAFGQGDAAVGVYVGQFLSGKRTGSGRELCSDKVGQAFEFYEGQFDQDQRSGSGRLCANGRLYQGSFHGKPNGKGFFLERSGERYVGDVVDGKRHGFGKVHRSDGSVDEGPWEDDRAVGEHVIVDAHGAEETASFNAGKQEGFFHKRTQSGRMVRGIVAGHKSKVGESPLRKTG